MIKRLERLKNTFKKYMVDLRPDRLITYQSEQKLVLSRRPGVLGICLEGKERLVSKADITAICEPTV
jgi:hypothetical protein